MYREKERQAATKGSPGKSAVTASQEQQPQPPAPVAEASVPLPPAPPPSEPSLSPLDTPVIGLEEELEAKGDGYMAPPNLEIDHGRDSPFRYVHGAPLHNVAEEEEED